jgi:uncharacterized protein (TIGR03790 family)
MLLIRRLLAVLCAFAAPALLAQTSETVLVVVNENSPLSRNIGEYYARKRSVPITNICRIRSSVEETIDRTAYVELERAVANCLRSRKLIERVLYIVTTAGVPMRVSGTRSGMDADYAAVDSELTLLYSKLRGKTFGVNGMVPNPLFNRPDVKFGHPEFPIYLVTRLAAYDFPGVRALIDRGLQARNTGMFVLDAKAGTDAAGDDWLLDAAIRLPGGRTVHETSGKVLYEQKNVIGYAAWGSNDPNRKRRRLGFTWLPGAVVTEYVSTNARTFSRPPANWNIGTWKDQSTWFAGSPQTMIADYIEEGVTGIAGHVYEPFLSLTPRPQLLLPAWSKGRNLAESFYLSIPGLSWQNIVVGDPLCSLGAPAR